MSGSGVRLQMPDVLSSVQLKNLELKSLTNTGKGEVDNRGLMLRAYY